MTLVQLMCFSRLRMRAVNNSALILEVRVAFQTERQHVNVVLSASQYVGARNKSVNRSKIDSISGLDATIKILAEQYRWTKNKLS